MSLRNLSLLFSSITLAFAAPAHSGQDRAPLQVQSCGFWPGYHKISHIFAFGDSYTSTGFKVTGSQPTSGNPTGNPSFPGITSSNGPNWMDYLVARYNASEIMTYNLAHGGATVDDKLAKPVYPRVVRTLNNQIRDDWLPVYGSRGLVKGKFRDVWGAENSLFTLWIGINDVLRTHATTNTTLVPTIFDQYEMLLGEVNIARFIFIPLLTIFGSYTTAEQETSSS
jgi:hypothetical protein